MLVRRYSLLISFVVSTLAAPGCARSVRPIQPPSGLTDVLRQGKAVPHEAFVELVREGIESATWVIERDEVERTGGRISHTTMWIHRVRDETRVDVRVDVRDGMYGLIITASKGLPRNDADWVVLLDESIRDALGIDYSESGDAMAVDWSP
ncbi:MAG: hypothetical protein AAF799_20395 [Myxococcota bacterium]